MTTLIPKFDLKNGGSTPTGAVNRPINLKLQESISVLDFINESDIGTTNDVTYAFTNAIATLKNVYIPSGTYYLTGNLTLNQNQILYGNNRSNTILNSSITTGNFITAAFGARVENLQIVGVWIANSSNTSVALYGGFGGFYDGGVYSCLIQKFYIGINASNSVQTFENNLFQYCMYGYKSASINFNDSHQLVNNWFTFIGQTITATPSSVTLSSGSIYSIVVPNGAIFEQYTPISQATSNAKGLIQSINSNTLTVYVLSGTFNTSNVITNFQGAGISNTYRSLNVQIVNNQIGQSTNFINNGGSNGDITLTNNWTEQLTGAALISSFNGSYYSNLPSGIYIGTNNAFGIINDPTVTVGISARGYQAVQSDISISGIGLLQTSNSTFSSPIRSLFNNGYQNSVTNAIVSVMGLNSDANDNSYIKQFIWNVTNAGGNTNSILNLGYATNYSNTYGSASPLPLTANIVSFAYNVFYPANDNATYLGSASNRWSTVYAGTGTINTSDANQKTDIVEISDVEKRVAVKLKSSMKRFKFKDGKRYHFGTIAQDVKAAFESEGLVAEEYGLFCSDTLEDGTIRLGIRYDELFAFIISAL